MRKPDQSSNAGNLEEVADWGRLLFGYFILAKQEKVTCCRSTTGGVDLLKGRIGETTSQSTKPTSWQVAGYAIRPYPAYMNYC
jgi:hypothetical protein